MTSAVDFLAGYGGRQRVAEAFAAQNLSPDFAHALLAARSSLFGAGNRRRLFGQFDDLLRDNGPAVIGDLETGIQDSKAADSPAPAPYAVQLRSIKLRNWKVFERARFDFPRFSAGRPVVLIGGKNGYGKTSLLEAILFGLYGQGALLNVDRALRVGGGQSGSVRAKQYRQIIDRIFHEPARARGDEVAAVHLSFETSNGPLEVERRWYMRTGGHSSDDDEVCRESFWGLRRAEPADREVESARSRIRSGWGRSRASGGPGLWPGVDSVPNRRGCQAGACSIRP